MTDEFGPALYHTRNKIIDIFLYDFLWQAINLLEKKERRKGGGGGGVLPAPGTISVVKSTLKYNKCC